MWIFVLAFVYFLPIFTESLPPIQEPTPRIIFGKTTAIDVDLLNIDDRIVKLRGVKAVTYKRRPEERGPLFHIRVMLEREPVWCEDLEKYNAFGKQWFLGTCYLVGKKTEVDLNGWVVANGFAKSFGNDDYLEDERVAKELGLGMWNRRVGVRPLRRSPRAEQSDRDRPLRTGEGSDC